MLLAVNHFFIFAAMTLTRLEEARSLRPPDRKLQKLSSNLLCVICTAKKTVMGGDEGKINPLPPSPEASHCPERRSDQWLWPQTSWKSGTPSGPPPSVSSSSQEYLNLGDEKKEMPGGVMEWRERMSWKKAITERGMKGINEEHRGKADWYSYSFLYAHRIRGIFYGFPADVTAKTLTVHVLGGLMVHFRANYVIQTQKCDHELEGWIHMFMHTLFKCVCVCVRVLPTAWGASICVNPAEKVMSTTG